MAMQWRPNRKAIARLIFASMLIFALTLPTASPADRAGAAQTPAVFRTKHARFEPALFDALPGWRDDRLGDAWSAFRQSCKALIKRPAWQSTCAESARLDANNEGALRQFFEQEFDLFQIHNVDATSVGVITGYYEPQLFGSRHWSAATPYPVYAVPDDMLFLDARLVPASETAGTYVRLDGRNMFPVESTQGAGRSYRLELAGIEPDIRTRRYRLRIDGERIVPYLSRQEIERAPLAQARVIAWVDSRAALYSLHLQGSGKIKLSDGKTIRVGYAEQNGHAFQPSVLATAQYVNAKGASQRMLTRGLGAENDRAENDRSDKTRALSKAEMMAALEEATPDFASTEESVRTRGLGGRTRLSSAVGSVSDVERMIEMLMQSGQGKKAGATSVIVPAATKTPDASDPATLESAASTASKALPQIDPVVKALPSPLGSHADSPTASAATAAAPAEKALSPAAPPSEQSGQITSGTFPANPSSGRLNASLKPGTALGGAFSTAQQNVINSDPSFVFFREISNTVDGPIGALGIPLTAGRSLAVDPRTTPLGFPVFISTHDPARKQTLNRLMLAQDTGGAIRGAVRADYFWGFGEQAFAQASQMKEEGRMWLLLPKALRRPDQANGPITRGMTPSTPTLSECVVPDAELCVE